MVAHGPVAKFIENLDCCDTFRKKFSGLLFPVMTAVKRLGGGQLKMPAFLGGKVSFVEKTLKDEVRMLEIMKAEVAAREERIVFLKDILGSVDKGEFEPVFGFESRMPGLPLRPRSRRSRRWKRRNDPHVSLERTRKRKRSLSRPPVSGGSPSCRW